MNQCQLIGRLVKDPELRYSTGGTPVVKFTLAINRQNNDEADFISCVAFNKLAENLANYQKKGNRIAVTGRIQTGSYENQQGQKIYTTDVIANSIEFLDYRSENAQNGSNSEQNYQSSSFTQGQTQNASTAQKQPNFGQVYGQPTDDPFASGGAIEVSEDELPF